MWEIGSNSVIAAQAGISGSTKIGRNVMIGGQAGIVGHIQIADGSKDQCAKWRQQIDQNALTVPLPAHPHTTIPLPCAARPSHGTCPTWKKGSKTLEDIIQKPRAR